MPLPPIFMQANILLNQPHEKSLSASNEAVHAKLKLLNLYEAQDQNLKPFAELAGSCLVPEFRRRPTARQLLAIVRAHMIVK